MIHVTCMAAAALGHANAVADQAVACFLWPMLSSAAVLKGRAISRFSNTAAVAVVKHTIAAAHAVGQDLAAADGCAAGIAATAACIAACIAAHTN